MSTESTIERRQITVMFCDIVESTRLAHYLDPEDLRTVLRRYQECVAGVVEQFGGSVIRYVGDGVLVYFGYPAAYEDEAERAVKSALAIVAQIDALSIPLENLESVRMQVRIGIATGLVVTGDLTGGGASEETLAFGETPYLAAKLQELAPVNAVTVNAGTRALIEGLFELQTLGSRDVKGIPDPVPMWLVTGLAVAPSRFAARHTAQPAELVGRDKVLGELLELWRTAKNGSGQVALLTGEAGIGKSRIAQSLLDYIVEDANLTVQYQCSSIFSNSQMYPFVDWLANEARLKASDSEREKFEKLRGIVGTQQSSDVDTTAILSALLSISVPLKLAQSRLSAQQRRDRAVSYFCRRIESLSQKNAVLVIFEDAHWCDPTSMEVLRELARRLVSQSIMLLIVSRGAVNLDSPSQDHITELTVGRLDDLASEMLVKGLDENGRLATNITESVVRKAGGVPLYIEELTKALLRAGEESHESASAPNLPQDIPDSLQGTLMSQLDGLGLAKPTAQLAAVIGQEFSSELLALVSAQSSAKLAKSLEDLVAAQIFVRPTGVTSKTYAFRHALIRDAAYQSQLKSRRRELHGNVARALDEHFQNAARTQPEVLAYHYAAAGEHALALEFFDRAGRRALDRAAYQEAIAHLSNAINSLQLLAKSEDRAKRELKLHIMLGLAHFGPDGFSGPNAEECFKNAQILADRLGPVAARFHIDADRGVYSGLYTRGELVGAREIGEKTLAFSESHDPRSLVVGHWMLGAMMFWQGEFNSARHQLERALATYDPDHIEPYSISAQLDVGVHALNHLAWTLWILGLPDQAKHTGDKAVARAAELNQPFTLGMALFWSAAVYLCCREYDVVEKLIAELSSVSTEHALSFLRASSNFLESHLLTMLGNYERGLAAFENAVAGFREQGSGLGQTFALAAPVQALAGLGNTSKAMELLNVAINDVQVRGEHVWEAELYRLRGNVQLLDTATGDQAEESFRRGIEVARQQGARAFELRATTCLAKLLQSQERTVEAREILCPIFNSFSEGQDTQDVIDAKELLEQFDQDLGETGRQDHA